MRKTVIMMALLVMSMPLWSATKLTTHVGDVQYSQGGSWKGVSTGLRLTTGDMIKTGSDGYAELQQDGTRIQVQSNTQFKITTGEDKGKRTGTLSMLWGKLVMKVKKLGKHDNPYTVTTPASVAAVRGTEYSVATGKDGSTLVQVTKGAVAVKGESQEVKVRANQETTVPYGGDPSKIRILTKHKWKKWLQESQENMKGNELKLMKVSLRKARKLDSEIVALEEYKAKKEKEDAKLKSIAKEYKKKGDIINFKKYIKNAYRARREAFTRIPQILYKADKIELIRNLSKATKSQIPKNQAAMEIYQKIDSIYQKYYTTYIMKIYENRRKRGLIK